MARMMIDIVRALATEILTNDRVVLIFSPPIARKDFKP